MLGLKQDGNHFSYEVFKLIFMLYSDLFPEFPINSKPLVPNKQQAIIWAN